MNRCVFVIAQDIPVGLVANTAAILSMTLGRNFPNLIGPDLIDGAGTCHRGITTVVLPILKATSDAISTIRSKVLSKDSGDIFVADVSNAAQETKSYEEYAARLQIALEDDLRYLGLCLYGPDSAVRSLTGNLPLFR